MFTKNGLHEPSATVTKLKRNLYAKLNRLTFGLQSVVYNFSPIVTASRFPQTTESYTAVNCAMELHGIMGYDVVKLDGRHLAESDRMEYRCELDFVIKIQWRHANERTFTVRRSHCLLAKQIPLVTTNAAHFRFSFRPFISE